MERTRRLIRIWNWLPVFRVVAESEHLPTASKELNLSASALSRTIKLLEDDLGQPLFRREGGRLLLNESGRALLGSVRDSMQRLEAGVDTVSTTQFLGALRLVAPAPLASHFVLPAVSRLRKQHPLLVPHLEDLEADAVNKYLLTARVDVAITHDPMPDDWLEVQRVGELTYGIYCGEGHPLFDEEAPGADEVFRHPFVAPPQGVDDQFPPHLARDVGLCVTQPALAVQACATGDVLAFLPTVVAKAYRGPGALRRVPIDPGVTRPVYAVHRAKLDPNGPAATVIRMIAELM